MNKVYVLTKSVAISGEFDQFEVLDVFTDLQAAQHKMQAVADEAILEYEDILDGEPDSGTDFFQIKVEDGSIDIAIWEKDLY